MLTPDLLHDYQKKAVNFQCTRANSMLWLDMGLGKTVITLTSLSHLLNTGFLRSVIIVAPIRVIRLVWRQEAVKWEHTKHLKFSMVAGTKDQRTRALLRPADVYLINYENLRWLAETLQTYFVKKNLPIPFDGIVWDEISKMKNSSTDRVKAVRKVLEHFKWTTGLTGTPASNGYKDLHGQFLVVDKGERLGTSKTAFRTRFYQKVGPYKEVAYPDTEETIKRLIGDITLEMSAEDYNPLPDLIVNNIELEMPDDLRAKYDTMEKEFFLQLDSGAEVEMFNQASLTNKCLQFSNGAMYPVAGMPLWEPIHDLKLEALEDILDEANGQPVLCAYAYRSDAQRIMERFKALDPINLTECKTEQSLFHAMDRWKNNYCRLMIGHPACLHPRTQVLTEFRGWVKIVDVKPDERVFDGVEFVAHDGCSYSGYKPVIDVFGIIMTPNHKILVNDEWLEGKHVQNCENSRQAALYEWEISPDRYCGMPLLRRAARNDSAKRNQEQQETAKTLSTVHISNLSQTYQHANMANMARNESERKRSVRQKLRRAWNNGVRRMELIRPILQRYVERICGQFNNRTYQCESAILQNELQMGYQYGTTIQQTKQSNGFVQRRNDSFGRIMQAFGFQQNDDDYETKSWNDWRRSGRGRNKIQLRQECKSQTKAHVYDIVNCGPRNRFLIRNDEGEMFISHNSMGHGVDGLQKNGHILVWYGLNWSLDLYEQFNARVRRQGQGVPVICHRILIRDTLDQAQSIALQDKAQTQSALRSAVKKYRDQKQ